MSARAPFPWEAAMQAGLGHLRLPPDGFWRMTPRELAAALGLAGPGAGGCDRETLRALMRRFPDT